MSYIVSAQTTSMCVYPVWVRTDGGILRLSESDSVVPMSGVKSPLYGEGQARPSFSFALRKPAGLPFTGKCVR